MIPLNRIRKTCDSHRTPALNETSGAGRVKGWDPLATVRANVLSHSRQRTFSRTFAVLRKEGGAAAMAVTAALAGQDPGRVVSSGGTSGGDGRRTNSFQRPPLRKSLPLGSFDGHYNLVSTNHVEPAARGRLDGARVTAQLLDLLAQRPVATTQSFDIRLNPDVLLGSQIHLRSSTHRDCDAYCRSGQNNHSEDYPGRYDSTTPANVGPCSDDLQRDLAHWRKRRSCARCYTLRPNSFVNPISICDPAQEAPPSPLLILIPRKCVRAALCPKGASVTTIRPRK